jgi:hypothetical protein
MLNHRGLTITTLDLYEFIIAEIIQLLGDEPEAYTAAALRDFVLLLVVGFRLCRPGEL